MSHYGYHMGLVKWVNSLTEEKNYFLGCPSKIESKEAII